MGYASRTGGLRNLAILRDHGWRLMVSASGRWRGAAALGFAYALDNGAWTAYQSGQPFDVGAFEGAVSELGSGADFVVVPDIVCGGLDSLRLSEAWLPKLDGIGLRRVIAVQDGFTAEDVRPLLGPAVGIFVGGGTEWKERTLSMWGELARERGAYLHVGRVNSQRRIQLCAMAGADSFDGTSVSRYAVTMRRLDPARRQLAWVM